MTPGVFIILYADDIMLLAPTACELNRLLKKCQCELQKNIIIEIGHLLLKLM